MLVQKILLLKNTSSLEYVWGCNVSKKHAFRLLRDEILRRWNTHMFVPCYTEAPVPVKFAQHIYRFLVDFYAIMENIEDSKGNGIQSLNELLEKEEGFNYKVDIVEGTYVKEGKLL